MLLYWTTDHSIGRLRTIFLFKFIFRACGDDAVKVRKCIKYVKNAFIFEKKKICHFLFHFILKASPFKIM